MLTLLMDLPVSVCQDSLVMVTPLEMDAGVRASQFIMSVFADMTLININFDWLHIVLLQDALPLMITSSHC